jgi:hypothetical protein
MSQRICALALPHPNGEIIALGGKFAHVLDWCSEVPCPLHDVALVQYYYPISSDDYEPSAEAEAYIVAVANIPSVQPMVESDEKPTRASYKQGLYTWRFSDVRRPKRALKTHAQNGIFAVEVPDEFMDTLRF